MEILCIGNSFSQDACSYLNKVAAADDFELNTINVMIGGCPLYKHFQNLHTNEDAYGLEVNGTWSGFKVALKEAIISREWDVVTIQQVSSKSFDYSTYQPYLNEVIAAVRKYAPKSKLAVHETWAYEEDSPRLNAMGFEKQIDMYNALHDAYGKAAKEIGADFIIPSGTLFQKLLNAGITSLHRDSFHASLNYGRYALGLLWYHLLTGNSVLNNSFDAYKGDRMTEEEKMTIKKCVEEFSI